jgi:hypothetical protein
MIGRRQLRAHRHDQSIVIPSEVEESVAILLPEIFRDVSTSVDMTKNHE